MEILTFIDNKIFVDNCIDTLCDPEEIQLNAGLL